MCRKCKKTHEREHKCGGRPEQSNPGPAFLRATGAYGTPTASYHDNPAVRGNSAVSLEGGGGVQASAQGLLQAMGERRRHRHLPHLPQPLRRLQARRDLDLLHRPRRLCLLRPGEQVLQQLFLLHPRLPFSERPAPRRSPKCRASASNARNCPTRTAPGCLPRASANSSMFCPPRKRPTTITCCSSLKRPRA